MIVLVISAPIAVLMVALSTLVAMIAVPVGRVERADGNACVALIVLSVLVMIAALTVLISDNCVAVAVVLSMFVVLPLNAQTSRPLNSTV